MSNEWCLKDVYEPHPKQKFAHQAPADEILYGGAKGSGKSLWLLMESFFHCMRYKEDAHVALFRRSFPELERTLIKDAKFFWPIDAGAKSKSKANSIGRYVGDRHEVRFDNGAIVEFGHLDSYDDVLAHFGVSQYTLIGIDELTLIPYEHWYLKLMGCLRSPRNAELWPRMLSTTNPTGPGNFWVRRRFVEPAEPQHLFHVEDMTRVFVPATVYDNKVLMENDPQYVHRLEAMPEADRKAYLEGSWDVFEGRAFGEWYPPIHILDEPFEIPEHWKVIRTLDWGYSENPFYVGWIAQDPETENAYLVDEWYGRRAGPSGGTRGMELPVKDVAQGIVDQERSNNLPRARYTLADPEIWRRRREGPTVKDLFMKHGVKPIKRANNDREMRKQVFHELLRCSEDTGDPRFRVFPHCKGFISTFPTLQIEEEEEKVKKCRADDPYDSVGYGLVDLAPSIKPRTLEPKLPDEVARSVKGAANPYKRAGITPARLI